MKITSSKNNFAFSDSESGFYTLSANQTTGISANDPVKFDTAEVGSNVTFNPATYTWTLKKNRRYKLNASLLALFTADTGRVTIRFYDVTNSAYLGIRSYSTAPNFSTARNSTSSSTNIIITPATDILVQCRIESVSGLDYFYTGYAYCEIQQLNVVSPVIQDPTRQVAYTSPPLALSVAGGAGFTLLRGYGIFTKYSDGSWYVDLDIRYSQTASTTGDITITGIVFKTVPTINYSYIGANSLSATTLVNAGVTGTSGLIWIRGAANMAGIVVAGKVELNAKPTGFAQIPSDV